MRCRDGVLIGLLSLLAAGCAEDLRSSTGSTAGNAYISSDIAASRAASATDLRDLRAIEPGRSGFSFGGGAGAPSDYLSR
jgi:hypothetical protein